MSFPGSDKKLILTINGGSSSIKFALFEVSTNFMLRLKGEIKPIGSRDAKLHINAAGAMEEYVAPVKADDPRAAARILIDWLQKYENFTSIIAVGHRMVHGMQHTAPEKITPVLINTLKGFIPFDPEHLPGEIALAELFVEQFPLLVQVACFDTSFHCVMPAVAKLLPLPQRFIADGLQRYGFHGLSYTWLMEELHRRAGAEAANGRIILAHLGSGASLAAVKDGKSIDTSMGFTPASGLPMGTRTGDIDPGVAWYLMREAQLSSTQFNHVVNHESGLLGISGTSADMRILLQSAAADSRAREAVDYFCYQTKKWIGAFAAALGGLDILVFSGGIGEHAPEIRKTICSGLRFLGIELEDKKNEMNEIIISNGKKKVFVYVIPANEELMLAKLTAGLIPA